MQSLVAFKKSVYLRQMKVTSTNGSTGHVRKNGKIVPLRYNTNYALWAELDMNESALQSMTCANVL